MEDIESKIYEWAKQYAEKEGLKVNADQGIMVQAIKGLAMNKREHGIQYCGCRQVTGNKEKDKEIICPCIHRNLDIKIRGTCKCGLFMK